VPVDLRHNRGCSPQPNHCRRENTMAKTVNAYADHLDRVRQAADSALAATGFDHLLIASGCQKYQFLDDRPYDFVANPHFKWWLPLGAHPDCWIRYTPGARPMLAYHQPADYWHLPPSDPTGEWVEHFDVRVIREPAEARAIFPASLARTAILGEADAALGDAVPNNPDAVLHRLHLARTRKTGWELDRMRAASRRAARAHRSAAATFRTHGSEHSIHAAYCEAAGQGERELPYTNIVCLNEHAAVLHYQHQDRTAPAEHRSLLIDAGASVHGYAADITRTYGNGDATFTALLEGVNRVQMALADATRPGRDFRELHLDAHLGLAGVLSELGIVRMEPAAIVDTKISSVFFPHGLGHFLGLQVHDVAGFLADESGATIPKPDGHPFLRCTRTLEAGNVITIEPGIYFIDMLLAEVRRGPHARAVDWSLVEHLARFGGVRIEDDLHVTDGAPENLTRDAFRALA
jgi:Xaa-Pro dipeptidase